MSKLSDLYQKDFIDINIPIGISIRKIVLVILIAYLGWEIYWGIHVGYPAIKWHTHLMLYIYVGFAGQYLFRRVSGPDFSKRAQNLFLAFSAITFSLFVIEIILAITGINKTYIEKFSGGYTSPYTPHYKNYYHTWPQGPEHWLTKEEFAYWRPTNSLGFGDREWPRDKKTGEKRILTLGDSFTEGDGAHFDSTYVAFLRQDLTQSEGPFFVMNGGICGSDPFINYINLQDRLMAYRPDIVIQSIRSSDMDQDIVLRGGLERFKQSREVKYKDGPWWEPIYALSYISRLFLPLQDIQSFFATSL